jgi:hypothetical protein
MFVGPRGPTVLETPREQRRLNDFEELSEVYEKPRLALGKI